MPGRPPAELGDRDLDRGTLIAHRYALTRVLGRGGMGDVYEAATPSGRRVALKLVRRSLLHDRGVLARFAVEIRALQRVRHRNVVAIEDSGVHEGVPYLVMEYVAGANLDGLLRMAPCGRLSVGSALDVVMRVCDGVQAVHDAGVIHNDLKTGNVIAALDGRVVVGDLGMARPRAGCCRIPWGVVEGTPSYLAPELAVAVGATPSVATDVYALGVLAVRLLTGRLPFAGASLDVLRRQVSERPPRPSSLLPGLALGIDEAVLWALDKDPDRRPGSAAALRDALMRQATRRRRGPRRVHGAPRPTHAFTPRHASSGTGGEAP